MEFRVLGRLEVSAGGRTLPLRGPKQRALLAALLLHANRAVSVDRLVETIWGDAAPATVVAQVQAQASALRAALAGAGQGQPLLTEPPGYRLRVEPGQLDLEVFERLTCAARQALAEARAADAADGFREALGLWTGPALDGVTSAYARSQAARLEELRLAALEGRIEADLALSRHAEVIGELMSLVVEHPLHERLRAQLMIALYRDGRQAEALESYRAFRALLVDELGLEPGAELRRLERAILTGDVPLQCAPVTLVASPSLLPADIADFTGRDEELAVLADGLAPQGNAPPVAVVVGQAGVGKTALAVHAAHRLRGDFPDGQLFADLRGMATPAAPAHVLARFLRALGVDDAAIPDGDEERAEMYRGRLADRRVLVVLDNVACAEQVRPVLPGTGGCAVLITSRFSLAGIAGARLTTLAPFGTEQAIELLGRSAGAERVAAEPDAAESIVRACGGLPLAVRVAGARLAARWHWPLSRLAERLCGERRRLDELVLGDLEVRASIALSYEALDAEHRRAFRRLGLLDVPDFAAWLAGALLDVPPERAADVLDALADAHVVEIADGPRYRVHDLLREYARERVEAEDPEEERAAALARAFGAWLALIDAAAKRSPSGLPLASTPRAPRWSLGGVAPEWHPAAWIEAEQAALVAAVEQASAMGFGDVPWELTAALVASPFAIRNRFTDWSRTHRAALQSARRTGSTHGEAIVLCGLGQLRYEQDRFGESTDCFSRAAATFRELHDARGEAVAECGVGINEFELGDFAPAVRRLERALSAFERMDDPLGVVRACCGLGGIHRDRGDSTQALAHLGRALVVCRVIGDRRGEAFALRAIGLVHRSRGELDQAVDLFQRSLAISRAIEDRHREAYGIQALAKAHIRQGRGGAFQCQLEGCLRACRSRGDRFGEALVARTLGELHVAEGRLSCARERLESARRQWDELGLPIWRARTLRDLASVSELEGDAEAAQASRDEALEIFRAFGCREADEMVDL